MDTPVRIDITSTAARVTPIVAAFFDSAAIPAMEAMPHQTPTDTVLGLLAYIDILSRYVTRVTPLTQEMVIGTINGTLSELNGSADGTTW